MFVAIYRFNVKLGLEKQLIASWAGLTKLIYQHEGSLGSRLHQEKDGVFIAYAQWPDRETWENAGGNMPQNADKYRKDLREACTTIETLHELEMVEDLLAEGPFGTDQG